MPDHMSENLKLFKNSDIDVNINRSGFKRSIEIAISDVGYKNQIINLKQNHLIVTAI